jgi:hypothetical protein
MLLVDTVRSAEHWQARARCLEALGAIAGDARRETAERILAALMFAEQGRDSHASAVACLRRGV